MYDSRAAKITSPLISLSHSYVRLIPLGLLVGAIGIGLALTFGMFSGGSYRRFAFSYLVTFSFLLSLSLGAMFFVIVQHLTKAAWGVPVRRIAEILAMCTFPLIILFLPILLPVLMGSSDVYPWNTDGWAGDTGIENLKSYYLVNWFFGFRWVIYFVAWGLMAWNFFGKSLKQDQNGDPALTLKMQRSSTWIMILFAATLVFASFDLEMSLSPLWFSTMFPVYFFAGAVMSGLAAITLVSLLLQRSGRVTDEISVEQYHDLAKMMFGFVFFWGYIAFSQFMLIWYANIPEETFWFGFRINDPNWLKCSYLLLFGHLLIPFLGLMARTVRRNKTFLLFAAIYLLAAHWLDHFWIVMPQFNYNVVGNEIQTVTGFPFSFLIDVPCAVGMIGLYVSLFCLIAGDRPLLPKRDPRMGEALRHKNA